MNLRALCFNHLCIKDVRRKYPALFVILQQWTISKGLLYLVTAVAKTSVDACLTESKDHNYLYEIESFLGPVMKCFVGRDENRSKI